MSTLYPLTHVAKIFWLNHQDNYILIPLIYCNVSCEEVLLGSASFQNFTWLTTTYLLELPSPQWATKHPQVRCQIAADPTPTAHYQPDQQHHQWWQSCNGFSRHPCGLLWPLHHLCHPKNNVFMTLLQRKWNFLPKINNKNQTTGATIPAQLLTTP